MYAQKSHRCVNNNYDDNLIVGAGYHYIVMFWWCIGYKLINDRNDYRVYEHIYTDKQ